MIKKFEITQSMLHLYEKCGQAFKKRYLEGILCPPQAALTVGKSVDQGISTNFSQKVTTQEDLLLQEVLDATATTFDHESSETDWQEENPGRQKDLAIALTKAFHESLAPKIQPIAVQKKLSADVGDFVLGGTLDYIEADTTIGDSKTSKRAYEMEQVSQSVQPAMYSFLYEKNYGHPPKGFRFDVLIKPTIKIPIRTQQVEGQADSRQQTILLKRTEILHHAIKSGNFHYAPDGAWWCSKKWCGFWNYCDRGGKK